MKIKFLTVTELKQTVSAKVHQVEEKGVQYIITRGGKPVAILRGFKADSDIS